MPQKNMFFILLAVVFGIAIGAVVAMSASSSGANFFANSKNVSKISSSSTISSINSSTTTSSSVSIVSSSTTTSSESKKAEVPSGQKFTGWIGSIDTEMYLNFDKDKITGKYYNGGDKKWYELSGNFQAGYDNQNGTIILNEYENSVITGNFSFYAQDNPLYHNSEESAKVYNNNMGYGMGSNQQIIPAGVYYTNKLVTLAGGYTDSAKANYDVFLSTTQSKIDEIPTLTKELTVRKVDSGQPYDSTVLEDSGKYYFTFEDWKLPSGVKVGDKVKVTGKVRSYNGSQGFEVKGAPDYVYQNTNLGFFQITDFRKI